MRRLVLLVTFAGALLLATWVQAPAEPARALAASLSAAELAALDQAAQSLTPVTRQVDEEAARLRQHLAEQAPFTEPARDPFRFAAPAKPTPKPRVPTEPLKPVAVVEPVVLNVPASPAIAVPKLIGLTEDVVQGVTIRSAIVSMDDDLSVVKVGQTFSRFVVQSISATAVELVDVTSPNRAVTTITIR